MTRHNVCFEVIWQKIIYKIEMLIVKYFIKYHLSKYGKMLITVSTDDIFSKIGDRKAAWSIPHLFSRASRERG